MISKKLLKTITTLSFIFIPMLSQATSVLAENFASRAFYFRAAFTGEHRTAINDDFRGVMELLPEDSITSSGTGNTSEFGSTSIGFGVWLPVWSYFNFLLNVSLNADYMPGPSSRAQLVQRWASGGTSEDDRVFLSRIQVKSRRANIYLAMNGLYYLNNDWFVGTQIGGGVTKFHLHSEYFHDEFNQTVMLDQGTADHPGFDTITPFSNIEISLGRHINKSARVFIFANYNVTKRLEPVLRGSSNHNTQHSYLSFEVPKSWWQLGLTVTRDIAL